MHTPRPLTPTERHARDLDGLDTNLIRIGHIIDAAGDLVLDSRSNQVRHDEMIEGILCAAGALMRETRAQLDALHTRMSADV